MKRGIPKGTKLTRWTQQEKDLLINLYKQQVKLTSIAEHFPIRTYDSVVFKLYRILKKENIWHN